MQILKRYDTKDLIYKTETDSQRTNLQLLGREGWGKGTVREFGMDMNTLLYLMDNQQGPTV